MNPDGRVNKASLAYDLAFYTEQGLVKGSVNLDDVVDGLVRRGRAEGARALPAVTCSLWLADYACAN
jgi:hypothetical protein